MTDIQHPSLRAKFLALHAEREREWDPNKLRANIEQREALVKAFDPRAVVKPGDRPQGFELEGSAGGAIRLDTLLAGGPVVLIFFRYAGCPACNLALPYYNEHLLPGLRAEGATLVAVSPHLPETGLDAIRARHGLDFIVAADRGNVLGRHFGITFVPDGAAPPPTNDTGWIGALTGTDSWELPQPAVVIIDQDRIVRFVDVSPDWLDRTEAPEILDAIRGLKVAAAA